MINDVDERQKKAAHHRCDPKRICLIYDGLFPYNIGGAERWYRSLAERLVASGHRVTYLTMRQWDEIPVLPGVEIIAVTPRMALYRNGKRRISQPLRFGAGVLAHLLLHGRRYNVVHTASFPFFPLLAAGACRRFGCYQIMCDWFEVWSRSYWDTYLGRLGWIGASVQTLCALVPHKAYSYSRLHASRLAGMGVTNVEVLTGMVVSEDETRGADKQNSLRSHGRANVATVFYAGRFVPEKRIALLVDALALARRVIPEMRVQLFGDGPTRPDILRRLTAAGLDDITECPGFVSQERLDKAMASSMCVVQPSLREGYGLVVVEASALGVPAIVVPSPDNAAVELVSNGENGFTAASADPSDLANVIIRCWQEGEMLRAKTRLWYEANRVRLSIDTSIERMMEYYKDHPPDD